MKKQNIIYALILLTTLFCACEKKPQITMPQAVAAGDEQAVEYYLKHGGNVNQYDDKGRPLIILAAIQGSPAITEMLIKNGADVNAVDTSEEIFSLNSTAEGIPTEGAGRPLSSQGSTALIWAVISGNTDAAKLLIQNGAQNADKAIMFAISEANTNVIKKLIESNIININEENQYGITPLILASMNGRTNVAKLLIENGAQVDAVNKFGASALIYATKAGHLGVVKLLVKNKANTGIKTVKDHLTPLMSAAESGYADIVKYLAEETSADVNARDIENWTALIWASINKGHPDVVKVLLEHGADVNAVNNDGAGALMLASKVGDVDIVKLLLASKANVNLVSKEGKTALMSAKKEGHGEIVKLLEQAGARK